jgi:uncharacterized membrane protein
VPINSSIGIVGLLFNNSISFAKVNLGERPQRFSKWQFQNERYFNQEAVVLTEIAVILFYRKNELVLG